MPAVVGSVIPEALAKRLPWFSTAATTTKGAVQEKPSLKIELRVENFSTSASSAKSAATNKVTPSAASVSSTHVQDDDDYYSDVKIPTREPVNSGRRFFIVADPEAREDADGAASVGKSPKERAADNLATSFAQIRADLIGRLSPVDTPFGTKPLVYADWTASGRPVESIERFMKDVVLPRYGNTHTTSSETGAQTTAFREEARHIIADAVNAKVNDTVDSDVVLFTGSGSTAAVIKIAGALKLHKSRRYLKPFKENKPVVFVGPFEHHSNLLPWRESCADVVQIAENNAGGLDVDDLERQLRKFSRRNLKIGSFAAASNITGALEDTVSITRILHRAGALSFWDYATAAPYVDIDMNPPGTNDFEKALVAKDAVFISGHKFLGGAGTPGLLVCKKRLFTGNKAPVIPGGGTVFFVSHFGHGYLSNIEEREEGGTPDILGAIRLGLVYQMKQRLGSVEAREEELTQMGLSILRTNPRVALLGDTGRKRLPIFSFLIRHGDRFLHHNLVCALLNDLFGVQARSGCMCAGPYGIGLMGIVDKSLPKIKKKLEDDMLIIKPGFCRLSLAFFMSDAEVKYILDAIMFVADHGASFLPLYEPNVSSAEWKCDASAVRSTHGVCRKALNELHYGFSSEMAATTPRAESGAPYPQPKGGSTNSAIGDGGEATMFREQMAEAFRLAAGEPSPSLLGSPTWSSLDGDTPGANPSDHALVHCALETGSDFFSSAPGTPRRRKPLLLDKEAEALRWFYFPFEDVPSDVDAGLGRPSAHSPLITVKVYDRRRPWNEAAPGSERNTPGDAHAMGTSVIARATSADKASASRRNRSSVGPKNTAEGKGKEKSDALRSFFRSKSLVYEDQGAATGAATTTYSPFFRSKSLKCDTGAASAPATTKYRPFFRSKSLKGDKGDATATSTAAHRPFFRSKSLKGDEPSAAPSSRRDPPARSRTLAGEDTDTSSAATKRRSGPLKRSKSLAGEGKRVAAPRPRPLLRSKTLADGDEGVAEPQRRSGPVARSKSLADKRQGAASFLRRRPLLRQKSMVVGAKRSKSVAPAEDTMTSVDCWMNVVPSQFIA